MGKNRQFFSLINPPAEITKYAYPLPPSPQLIETFVTYEQGLVKSNIKNLNKT